MRSAYLEAIAFRLNFCVGVSSSVPNFGSPGTGMKLRPGMVLALEPMLNAGSGEVDLLDDGWTVVTTDGSLSAHIEHTVAITERGPWVLTRD